MHDDRKWERGGEEGGSLVLMYSSKGEPRCTPKKTRMDGENISAIKHVQICCEGTFSAATQRRGREIFKYGWRIQLMALQDGGRFSHGQLGDLRLGIPPSARM